MIMSKLKCEICNNAFDNFQAQGFENKIYCPLCYYKELYRRTELERERLNNIIEELEIFLKEGTELICGCGITPEYIYAYENCLDKLKELKGEDNE